MITVSISFSNGAQIKEGWMSKSSVRDSVESSFVPGDNVLVCHPNVRNLKHRNKVGILQDRYTSAGSVWVKFSDGSFGAVSAIALTSPA